MSLANRQVGLVTWLAGAGGLGLLVSFFLTWLSVPPFEVSASQLATLPDVNMGWLVLTPIAGGAALGIAVFLALQPPREPRTPALIIVLVGAAALLLTGIAFFSLNSALNTISQLGSSLGSLVRVNYQAGFGLGFWVALVSAGATIAGGVSGLSGLAPRETSPMTQRVVTPAPMSPSYRPSPAPAPDLTPTPLPKTVSGPRAQLRLESGPARGKTFEVRTGDIMIGRGSQCDIQVKDTTVSRVHAQIRYGQGAWFIQDQQSGYGTFVNEQRVPAIRLNANDRVRIGDDTTFTFLVE